MVSQNDLNLIGKKLEACTSVQEMFNVLQNNFDLQNCKPGTIAKPLFIKGIIQGIKLINPNKK